MGTREADWMVMPYLRKLVGIDQIFADNKYKIQYENFANLLEIELKLIAGDATKPKTFLDEKYNIIIDKRSISSLSGIMPSNLIITLPQTNYFKKQLENIKCELGKEFGYTKLMIINPRDGAYYPASISDFESEPENIKLILNAKKQLEFGAQLKIWRTYMGFLIQGGIIVSFDPLSHYLEELGLMEIKIDNQEIKNIYVTGKEATTYNLRASNWDEGINAMLQPPKIFIKK